MTFKLSIRGRDYQICRICKGSKPLTDYHKDPSKKTGVCNVCKQCRIEINRVTQIKRTERMNLNQAKFASIFNGLSSVVKKTYESVPIQTQWDSSQIHSDLMRQGAANDLKTTIGCLNTLVSSGLVKEPVRGSFLRVEVKAKTAKQESHDIYTQSLKEKGPMDLLISLSVKTKKISEMLSDLSKEIEDAALFIEEKMTTESEESKKLKQLQSILKSLG